MVDIVQGIMVVNTETIPGKVITETYGVVSGSTVRAKNIGRDITQGLKNIMGGEAIPDFIESISLLVSVIQILFCNTILFAFLALVYSKTKKQTNFDIPSGFHNSPPSQD